jgi:hypothetical protein
MKLALGSLLALPLFCVGPLALAAEKPPASPPSEPKLWKQTSDQAQILAATFIGGRGNEWLAAGAFAPDGTMVLAGNVAGPLLEFPDMQVQVIGTDLPAPPAAERVTSMNKGKNGPEPKLDKEGKPILEKPSWRHAGVTGFVVRMSPDLKKVLSVHRLPWTSGAVTSVAAGADGSIYIAGRASDQIGKIGGAVEEWPATPANEKSEARCDHAFVAKLSADAAKVEWLRHARGPCDAPQVAVQPDGSIRFGAQDVRTLNPSGKMVKAITIPGGVTKTSSVSPTDGTIVVAGEHHSPTGREPWRCPTMNIHAPDGTLKYQFYDWGGPYVGLDNLRLVSDSAVRFVTHDRDGSILLYAWSDGGNSVMTRQPYDVRTDVGHKGLGLSLAGAGVLSAAYIIRIDPADYHVSGWTAWIAMRGPNKPNSTWIDNMSVATDGSICIAGRSAEGLWQTPNKISNGPAAGDYVAVLRPDLSAVRFCSLIPGSGVTEASYDRAAWGIATGTVNSQPRALFVGGAAAEGTESGVTTATPTANAMQSKFGGGWSDGYVVLLDLSPKREAAEAAVAAKPPPGGSANFERSAGSGKSKKAEPQLPPEGTTFEFKPDVPKWITVDAEFRDRAGAMWPTFLYGKPAEGSATIKDGALAASLAVSCTSATQTRGDQSRRILGELYHADQPPPLRLTLNSLSRPKTMDVQSTDAKGKPQTRTISYCDAQGTLELADRKIAVTPRVTYGFGKTQGVYKGPGKFTEPADSVKLTAWMTLKASELGLKSQPADTQIDIRIGMSGLAPQGK